MSTGSMLKITVFFFMCRLTVSVVSHGRGSWMRKQFVQDGIDVDVHNKKEETTYIKRAIVDLKPTEVKRAIVDDFIVPMSAMESGSGICEDTAAEHTGFEVHDNDGFLKHASCEDLQQHCHDDTIGAQARVACPISCFLCTPATEEGGADTWHGKCFDAVSTGIRFRDGPKAKCDDLINYCNHASIGSQVQEACRLTCGLCRLHVEGPYVDSYGNCEDLASHEEPQFSVEGLLAGCSDMVQFCQNHPDSYLIRHKCPLKCGVCGNAPSTTEAPDANELISPGDTGGCDRRRRWGFCSTRRRDNHFNDKNYKEVEDPPGSD